MTALVDESLVHAEAVIVDEARRPEAQVNSLVQELAEQRPTASQDMPVESLAEEMPSERIPEESLLPCPHEDLESDELPIEETVSKMPLPLPLSATLLLPLEDQPIISLPQNAADPMPVQPLVFTLATAMDHDAV